MNKAPKTMAEGIEQLKKERTIIEDENGYLRMKKELTYWERIRLIFKKWSPLVSFVISLIALAVSILK